MKKSLLLLTVRQSRSHPLMLGGEYPLRFLRGGTAGPRFGARRDLGPGGGSGLDLVGWAWAGQTLAGASMPLLEWSTPEQKEES